ncbi:MAG: carboxypeptidase regulatory-like domain-containing protein [Deltaproteobacteria bacterium]|nr:carboxypeptidase regulatory-like domain-containing protein [Deltaproteobacteria bacterium]
MRPSIQTALTAAALLGCGIPAREGIPEDSRLVVCASGAATVPVSVVDSAGKPVEGATVVAEHLSTGETVEAQTNAQGRVTSVTSDLGTGTVRVSARFGDAALGTADVTWTCGKCNCTATPSIVTFTAK